VTGVALGGDGAQAASRVLSLRVCVRGHVCAAVSAQSQVAPPKIILAVGEITRCKKFGGSIHKFSGNTIGTLHKFTS
jgi:hypothetical protein